MQEGEAFCRRFRADLEGCYMVTIVSWYMVLAHHNEKVRVKSGARFPIAWSSWQIRGM